MVPISGLVGDGIRSWLVCALLRPNCTHSLNHPAPQPALCRPFAALQARLPCHRPQPQLKFFREVGFNLWGFGYPRPSDFGGRRWHSPYGRATSLAGQSALRLDTGRRIWREYTPLIAGWWPSRVAGIMPWRGI